MSFSQSYQPQYQSPGQGGQQQPKIPTLVMAEAQGANQLEQRLMRLVHRLHGSPPQAVGQGGTWTQQQDQGGFPNLERCIAEVSRAHGSANRLLDDIEQLI